VITIVKNYFDQFNHC